MRTSPMSLAWLCIGLALAGCSSSAERVNEAARLASLSLEKDRLLALETLARLPEESEDYRIGPNDVLEVGVFQWELSEETKTLNVRVSQEGTVSLPLIGDLSVKDKTVREVRVMIENALKAGDFIKTPRVSVVIKEFRSKRVAVVGAVRDPGVYTLRQNVTRLLDVLSLAGGIADTAGQYLYVVKTRPQTEKEVKDASLGRQIITVDLQDLLVLGDLTFNVVLADGDVVNVPLAQKIFVHGYVNNPGAFDLKRRMTVLEAVAMAGGLARPMASPSECFLRRPKPNPKPDENPVDEIAIDLTEVAEGKAPDFYLLPNDIIEVRQTLSRKIFLGAWEVFRNLFHIGYSLNAN